MADLSLRQKEIAELQQGIIPARYARNFQQLTTQDQIRLLESRVALVGLGGIGGALLEMLVRLGVGRIVAADGDCFDETNFNRQLLSTTQNIGQSKAEAALERAKLLNPTVELTVVPRMLDRQGMLDLVQDVDLVLDALGGMAVRQLLLECAREQGKIMVSGIVAGWTAMVSTTLPGQTGPFDLWQGKSGAEEELGCLAPTVLGAAATQCGEAVRILTGQGPSLAGEMFVMDYNTMTAERFTLSGC